MCGNVKMTVQMTVDIPKGTKPPREDLRLAAK